MQFERHAIQWTGEKVGRFWDYVSSNPRLRDLYFGLLAGKHVAQVIEKQLGFSKLPKILDMSCGKGDIIKACLPYLNESTNQIWGSDVSQSNVDHLNDHLSSESTFQRGVFIEQYPSEFDEEMFDLVILTEVIEHLDEESLNNVMKELNRIIKKDGFVLITTPNDEDLLASQIMCPDCGCEFHRWQHVRNFTTEEVSSLLKESSFDTIVSKPIEWGNSRLRRWVKNLLIKVGLGSKHSGILFIGQKV